VREGNPTVNDPYREAPRDLLKGKAEAAEEDGQKAQESN
jgi:hypothetical protein